MFVHLVLPPNIFLAQGLASDLSKDFVLFNGNELSYVGFCDDFGPMSASSIIGFMGTLIHQIECNTTKKLVYCAGQEGEILPMLRSFWVLLLY